MIFSCISVPLCNNSNFISVLYDALSSFKIHSINPNCSQFRIGLQCRIMDQSIIYFSPSNTFIAGTKQHLEQLQHSTQSMPTHSNFYTQTLLHDEIQIYHKQINAIGFTPELIQSHFIKTDRVENDNIHLVKNITDTNTCITFMFCRKGGNTD